MEAPSEVQQQALAPGALHRLPIFIARGRREERLGGFSSFDCGAHWSHAMRRGHGSRSEQAGLEHIPS